MEDILFDMPWTCGERDCPVQWHKSTYWGYFTKKRTTYTVDNYSDGDHESIRRKDLPSTRKIDRAWKEYSEYVAETGKDPLGSFVLPEPKKIKHSMQALVRQGSDRVLLKGIRMKGKLSPWKILSIPDYVYEYLFLKRSGRRGPLVLEGFKTLKSLQRSVRGAKHGDKVKIRTPYEAVVDFSVEEVIPLKASEKRAFLMETAKATTLS